MNITLDVGVTDLKLELKHKKCHLNTKNLILRFNSDIVLSEIVHNMITCNSYKYMYITIYNRIIIAIKLIGRHLM